MGRTNPEDADHRARAGRDAVVFVSLATGIGGPAQSLLAILEYAGRDVDRILFAPPGQFSDTAQRRGLVEEYVEMPWWVRLRQFSRVKATFVLARFVRRHRGRVVALHANGEAELNVCALPVKRTGVPVVMIARSSQTNPSTPVLAGFWRKPETPVRWLAVSETAQTKIADALGLEPRIIAVVGNPIDPKQCVATRVDDDTVRVGFLGQPWRVKGWHLVPAAITAAGPGIGWEIFASRPDPAVLPDEAAVWDRVADLRADYDIALRGRVADVRRAYARCDIVLCPSEAEALPRVALEAMANGLPVVATDLQAYRDLIGDDEAGLLVPVGDGEAAGRAVRRLAEDPDLQETLGSRGRVVAERFAPERILDPIIAAYRGG